MSRRACTSCRNAKLSRLGLPRAARMATHSILVSFCTPKHSISTPGRRGVWRWRLKLHQHRAAWKDPLHPSLPSSPARAKQPRTLRSEGSWPLLPALPEARPCGATQTPVPPHAVRHHAASMSAYPGRARAGQPGWCTPRLLTCWCSASWPRCRRINARPAGRVWSAGRHRGGLHADVGQPVAQLAAQQPGAVQGGAEELVHGPPPRPRVQAAPQARCCRPVLPITCCPGLGLLGWLQLCCGCVVALDPVQAHGGQQGCGGRTGRPEHQT